MAVQRRGVAGVEVDGLGRISMRGVLVIFGWVSTEFITGKETMAEAVVGIGDGRRRWDR